MTIFDHKSLTIKPDVFAPDGAEVRLLCQTRNASAAHFSLQPGQTSRAMRHRTVEEIWFIVAGQGEMWRQYKDREKLLPLAPDMCLTIPVGTEFQFRNTGAGVFSAYAVTMPPWPGEDEAVTVDGIWQAKI